MSIFQEYEQIRNQMGHKKYDMISKYLSQIVPEDNVRIFLKEFDKAMNITPCELWNKEEKKLKEKYNVVLFSDVLYKPEEWEKFEKWYDKQTMRKNKNERNSR